MPKKQPPFKRLYQNISYNDSGCWEWQGSLMNSGYGQIKAFGKMVGVHRLSYELYNGLIESNLEVMHTCNNKKCINPDHLTLGAHAENMRAAQRDGLVDYRKMKKPSKNKGVNSKQSIQVLVLGKAYGSINQAENEIGCASGTVNYWLRKKPEKAKIITREDYIRCQT